MVSKRNHPLLWPYFRLVKYYNLPRWILWRLCESIVHVEGKNNPGFLLIGCLEQQPQTSASFFQVGKPSELFMMFMFIVKAFF